MKVIIQVLAPLKQFVGNNKVSQVEGVTVGEAINALSNLYPKIGEQVFGESKSIREFINIFLNGEDIRDLNGLQTKVNDDDRIVIMPAIAGGRVRNAVY